MAQRDSLSLGHTLQSEPSRRPADEDGAVSVEIGQQIGSYRIVSVLGRGGMGIVFRAVHEQLSRQAAIKVLRAELSQVPGMVSRFFNEAESVNIIGHPGIVSIFEFGQLPDQTLYIVMEYLQGESLYQRQTQRRPDPNAPPPEGTLRLYRQIASALQAAHGRGIVHRDLKPENVIIVADPEVAGGERTKILDFGIAKMARGSQAPAQPSAAPGLENGADAEAAQRQEEDAGRGTRAGVLLGTPIYMSPEQCTDAATADSKADVYALGVMLYEALAGDPPFLHREATKILTAHLFSQPPPLQKRAPGAPPALVDLVERMLAKAPAARPEMGEVTTKLDALLERPAPAPAPPQQRPLWQRTLLALCLLVGLAAAGLSLHQRFAPAPPPVRDPAALRTHAIAVLREGLAAADPSLRRRAIVLLAQSGDGRLAPLLLPGLSDEDQTVQALSAEALGQLGAKEAKEALSRHLDIRNAPLVRVAAAGALYRLGEPAGEAMLRTLLDLPDEEARKRALLLLAERGDAQARDRLVGQRLRGEELLGLLGHRARAGEAAAKEELARALGAADAAAPLDEKALRVSEELLRSGDERGRPRLLAAVAKPGPLQLRAAWILAALGEPIGQPLFLAALSDRNRPLRERILGAEGLGRGGKDEGIRRLGPLVTPLGPGEPLLLRMAAAGALLRLLGSDPDLLSQDSLAWAEQALSDGDWTLRREATEVLGYAEGKGTLQLLGRALKDSQKEVRERAAWALGRSRDRAALPLLVAALSDPERVVREEAMGALGRLGERLRRRGESMDETLAQVGPQALAGEEGERLAGAAMLLGLGDVKGGAQSLIAALGSTSFAVRFRAAVLLGEQRLRDGVQVLREAMARGAGGALTARRLLIRLGELEPEPAPLRLDDDVARRSEVVALLPYLKPQEALGLLRQAAADPDATVRRSAVEAAEDLPGAEPVLRTLLADPDRLVRTQAAALLKRRLAPPTPASKAQLTARPPKLTPAPAAPAPAPAPATIAPRPVKKAKPLTRAAKEARLREEKRLRNNAIHLPKKALRGKASVDE